MAVARQLAGSPGGIAQPIRKRIRGSFNRIRRREIEADDGRGAGGFDERRFETRRLAGGFGTGGICGHGRSGSGMLLRLPLITEPPEINCAEEAGHAYHQPKNGSPTIHKVFGFERKERDGRTSRVPGVFAGYLSILIRFMLIRAEHVKLFHHQMRRITASQRVYFAIDVFGIRGAFHAYHSPSG